MMQLGQSKSITLEQLPKLSEHLLSTGRHKFPIVNLSVQNALHYEQVQEQHNNKKRDCGLRMVNRFTCCLCSLSVESGTSLTGCRIFVKILNSFTKGLPWSFNESIGSLTREVETEKAYAPLPFCHRCHKTVKYLENLYEELQETVNEFHETILRVQCFLNVSNKLNLDCKQLNVAPDVRDTSQNQYESNLVENEDKGNVKVGVVDNEGDEDDDDRNSYITNDHNDCSDDVDEEKPSTSSGSRSEKTGAHEKQRRSHLRTKKAYTKPCKQIRRHGGLTEEEYQEKRRNQLRGYYLSKRKPPLIGPKPLTAQSHIKLKRTEKLCLDSRNFPAKSNCGRKVPVIKLDENQYSYRNVQFSKVKSHVHETTEIFHCDKCNHSCGSLNVMKKHIAKIHFEPDHAYKCPLCEKTFYYQFQLRNHEARHTEKGMGVQCEECGMSFKYKSGYFNHRRIIHWGVKPFECDTCKKKFGTRKDLRMHYLTHSSEKPNVCQYCGDTFKTPKSLSAHEQKNHAN